jgi:hypothetical protein
MAPMLENKMPAMALILGTQSLPAVCGLMSDVLVRMPSVSYSVPANTRRRNQGRLSYTAREVIHRYMYLQEAHDGARAAEEA